jgi:hypothetical protein
MKVKPSLSAVALAKADAATERRRIIYLTVTEAGVNCNGIAEPSGVLATPLI